jgi:hypothetical protein
VILEHGSAQWPPRIALLALSIAFGVAVVGTTVTTVGQLNF